jgi:hypothetical protein
MGYLVCDKCGGYYELQEGESLDDFQGCECGGKFRYAESIDGLNLDTNFNDAKKEDNTLFCSNCGSKNLNSSTFCKKCGEKLNKNNLKTKNPQKMKNEPLIGTLEKSLRRDIKRGKNWWNNQTKQTRGGLAIVGIILFVGIIAVIVSNNGSYANPYSLSPTSLSESDYMASCQYVTVSELEKNPSKYIGDDIHLHGKITDIVEYNGKTDIILTGYETQGNTRVWYYYYVFYDGSTPYHTGDSITAYGRFYGLHTYISQAGTNETVVAITARYITSKAVN